MKKLAEQRISLGLSQREMAMLLGVSRSRIAMYEAGTRPSPYSSSLKLATLLSQVSNHEVPAQAVPDFTQLDKSRQVLKKLQLENSYQLESVTREIAAAQERQEAILKAQQIYQIVSANEAKDPHEKSFHDTISSKAKQSFKKYNLKKLILLEVRQAVLQFEKEFIESKIKELE